MQCWVIGKLKKKKKNQQENSQVRNGKKKKIRTENDTRATSLSPEQTHGKMPSIVSLHLAQLKQGVERASEQCSGDHNQSVWAANQTCRFMELQAAIKIKKQKKCIKWRAAIVKLSF